MQTPDRAWGHAYKLVIARGEEPPETIEFEASDADAALFRAERACGGREAELFEDSRSLGRLQCSGRGGFWILRRPSAGLGALSQPRVGPRYGDSAG